jgi:hypothetical protein
MSNCSKPDQEVTVKMLVGDLRKLYPSVGNEDVLVQRVMEAAKSEDDPPLLFQWDLGNLDLFALSTGHLPATAPASPLPPPAGGRPRVAYTMQEVANGIIGLVVAHNGSVPLMQNPQIEGDVIIGVACNLSQAMGGAAFLGGLYGEPWFAAVRAVLVAQNQNCGPLAVLYTLSMTENPRGLCMRIKGGHGVI